MEAQEKDENSVLAFYKKLIALRKSEEYKETVVYGKLVPFMEQEKNLIGFTREGDKKLLVLANFQKEPRQVALPSEMEKLLLNNLKDLDLKDGKINMGAYQFIVLELR